MRNQEISAKVRKLEVLEVESKRTKELLDAAKAEMRKDLAVFTDANLKDRIREIEKLLLEYDVRPFFLGSPSRCIGENRLHSKGITGSIRGKGN